MIIVESNKAPTARPRAAGCSPSLGDERARLVFDRPTRR